MRSRAEETFVVSKRRGNLLHRVDHVTVSRFFLAGKRTEIYPDLTFHSPLTPPLRRRFYQHSP
jgi:hypothetical protein